MSQSRTWKDVVADALAQLGGEAHLSKIIAIAKEDPKAAGNKHVVEKVRQVVRAFKIFETVKEGSGVYRLASDAAFKALTKPKTTSAITDEIQGKLLFIGKANDFETFAPSDDCSKRVFDGKPLGHLVTVRDISESTRFKKNELPHVTRIDVLWLSEEGDGLVPRYAFEIENSTKVMTGINRMSVIPLWFQTRLFIIGKDESQKKRFDKHINTPAYRSQAGRFAFKYFDEIRELFEYSKAYDSARSANDAAMKSAGLYK